MPAEPAPTLEAISERSAWLSLPTAPCRFLVCRSGVSIDVLAQVRQLVLEFAQARNCCAFLRASAVGPRAWARRYRLDLGLGFGCLRLRWAAAAWASPRPSGAPAARAPPPAWLASLRQLITAAEPGREYEHAAHRPPTRRRRKRRCSSGSSSQASVEAAVVLRTAAPTVDLRCFIRRRTASAHGLVFLQHRQRNAAIVRVGAGAP